MRGHEALIAMRLTRRRRPQILFIEAGVDADGAWRDWPQTTPHQARVEVQDGEALHALDLRFSVGLNVVIAGSKPERVQALSAACMAAGAARVVAAAVAVEVLHGDPIGRVLWSGDTAQ